MLWNFSLVEFRENARFIPPHLVFGCNFIVRREVLELANGFHPDSFPRNMIVYRGDGESHVSNVVQQNQLRAICLPDLSVRHRVSDHRLTVSYWVRRSFDQGISDSFASIRKQRQCIEARRRWWREIRLLLRLTRRRSNSFRRLSDIAREAGFLTHQRVMNRWPELLEWVMRPHYCGELAVVPGGGDDAARMVDLTCQRWIRRLEAWFDGGA